MQEILSMDNKEIIQQVSHDKKKDTSMTESLWQCLHRLDVLCKSYSSLSSLFYLPFPSNLSNVNDDRLEEDSVTSICRTVSAITDQLVVLISNKTRVANSSTPINDERVVRFLKVTFPILVELFLRRKTAR